MPKDINQEVIKTNPFDILNADGTTEEGASPVSALELTQEFDRNPQQTNANHVKNYIASMLATIKESKQPGISLKNEFDRERLQADVDPTFESQRQEAIQIADGEAVAQLRGAISTFFDQGRTDDVAAGLDVAGEVLGEMQQQNATKSIEDVWVDTFDLNDDEKRSKEVTFQAHALRDISQLLEDQSLIDKVVNYSGLFLLSDQGIDWSRVTNSSVLSSASSAEEFVQKFQSLPADVKERLWPEIKAAIHGATDENNIKTALALQALLDPSGAQDVSSEIGVSNIFLGIDIGTLGTAMFARLAKGIKSANIIKQMANAQQTERAAVINVGAAIDPTDNVLKNVGVARDVAAMNASPFKMADMIPEAADGISKESQAILREVELGRQETFRRLQSVTQEGATIKDGLLYEREKQRIKDKALASVDKYKEEVYQQFGWNIDDVKVMNSTEDGFTLSYMVEGTPVTRNIEYKLNDVGVMEAVRGGELKVGAVESVITSPAYKLRGVDEELVNSATRIELQRAKVWDEFTKNITRITSKTLGSPLTNPKRYKQVDDVLLAGDDFENAVGDYGKVYSISELRTGVRLRDDTIVKLDDKQISAYYQLRDLFDNAWVLKNQSTRKALKLNGMKEVMFDGIKTIGKPYESAGTAVRGLEDAGIHTIYNPAFDKGKGGLVRVASLDMEDLYNKGYRVVRFHKGSQEFGQALEKGQHVTHTLARVEDIGELPLHVIHYKKGYVPKIDKNGHYFVKEPITGTLDGVAGKTLGMRTLRVFDSRKEADTFIKSLQAKDPGKQYQLLHDRQMAQAELADEAIGLSGGLYTSPRASHPVLFGLEGTARPRLSAFESLQRNLQHLSNLIPRNEWRIGVQQRWLNTAYDMYEKTGVGLQRGEGFNAHIRGESHTKAWRALEESRKYIGDQLRIPTTEEKIFEDALRSTVEWAEHIPILGSKKLKGVRNSIMNLSKTDPFAAARSLTFHTLLGWFNPAQLMVQAQGFSVAFSLHPEHAHKVMRAYAPLRHMMHLPLDATEDVIRSQAKMWSKGTGIGADELMENFQLWRRSGLQESIRSTADHSASVQNFGVSSTAFRDLADKGLVFYREGEFVTRGYGLITAKEVWKAKNPGKVIDAAAEKDILTHAMKLQLNLTRANRAAWQRGALSIPTQFLQIQTKFLEKLFGRDISSLEKAKLLSMQLGLYGTAGVVGSNWMVNEFAQMNDIKPEDVDPELKRWLRGGVYDYMLYTMFGADVSIGKRGAITSGVEDFIDSLLYEGTPTAQAMLGAFGATGSRAAEAFKKLKPLALSVSTGDHDFTAQDVKFAASELGKMVSTWRNIDKALFLHRTGMAITGKGNITVDNSLNGGFNMAEIIAQGMGFQLAEIEDTYELSRWLREEQEHLEARADAIVNIHYHYASSDDPSTVGNTQLMTELIMRDLNPDQRQRVIQTVGRRVGQADSLQTRVIRDYYRNAANDITNTITALPQSNITIPTPEDKGK